MLRKFTVRNFNTHYIPPKFNPRLLERIKGTSPNFQSYKTQFIQKVSKLKTDSVETMGKILEKFHQDGHKLNAELYQYLIEFHAEHEALNLFQKRVELEKIFQASFANNLSDVLIKHYGSLETYHDEKQTSSNAVKYLELAEQNGFAISMDIYHKVLASCAFLGLAQDANKCLELLRKRGLEVTEKMISYAMIAHGKSGDAQGAQRAFELYMQSGFVPDVTVYTGFAKALVNARQVPAALDVLTRLMPGVNVTATCISYNQILFELINTGQLEDAEELFEMMNDGTHTLCKPDYTSDALGITTYSLLNKYEKALALFKEDKEYPLFDFGPFRLGYFGRLCVANGKPHLALQIFNKYCPNDLGLALSLIQGGLIDPETMKKLPESFVTPKFLYKNACNALFAEYLKTCSDLRTGLDILAASPVIVLDAASNPELWKLYAKVRDAKSIPPKLKRDDFQYLLLAAVSGGITEGTRLTRITEILDLLQSQNFKPKMEFYNTVLNFFQSIDLASTRLFQHEMHNRQLVPKDSTSVKLRLEKKIASVLLMQEAEAGNWDFVMEHFEGLVADRYVLRNFDYRLLLTYLVKTKNAPMVAQIMTSHLELLKERRNHVAEQRKLAYNVGIGLLGSIPAPKEILHFGTAYMKEFKEPFLAFRDVVIILLNSKSDSDHQIANELMLARQEIEPNYTGPGTLVAYKKPKSDLDAVLYYKNCKRLNIPVKDDAFLAIFRGLVQEKDRGSIMDLFDQYLEGQSRDIAVFNLVLQFFLNEKDTAAANNILKLMKSFKVMPDASTLSILVKHDMVQASNLFQELQDTRKVKPVHIELMIQAYGKANNLEGMVQILFIATKIGMDTKNLYKIVISKAYSLKKFEIGKKLFQQLKESNGTFVFHVGDYTLANGIDFLPLLASEGMHTALLFYGDMMARAHGSRELVHKMITLAKENGQENRIAEIKSIAKRYNIS